MRKTALHTLVLQQIATALTGEVDDVREALLASHEADPEGAFGAFCYYLDAAAGSEQVDVEAHLQQLLDSIQDKRADRIAEHDEPWSVLAAIVRDGDYWPTESAPYSASIPAAGKDIMRIAQHPRAGTVRARVTNPAGRVRFVAAGDPGGWEHQRQVDQHRQRRVMIAASAAPLVVDTLVKHASNVCANPGLCTT